MFGRATVRLGIGPHSSTVCIDATVLRSAVATASRTAESADYVRRTVRAHRTSESDIAEPAVSARLSSFISRSRYSVAQKTAHYHSCFFLIIVIHHTVVA